MIKTDQTLKAADLSGKLEKFWHLSESEDQPDESQYDESKGSPVFTVKGKYSTRG